MTIGDIRVQETARRGGALRNYQLLFGAFVVSAAGDWLYKLALPLVVLSLTGSPIQTSIVYSLEYVPYLLFAMVGGVISDRYNRRLLLIAAQSAAAAVTGALAILAWFNQYHLWAIYVAAFLLSTITPVYQATFLATVPSTVPKDRLSWANSRMQAGQSALDLAGPLLGGSAVAALGARWALSLDSTSFALSALAVALIARVIAVRPKRTPATVRDDLKDAARFVRNTPMLLWGAITAFGSSLGLQMVEGNMLTYLVRYRHHSVAAVGVVFAALGAGALIGALVAPRITRLTSCPGRVIIGSVLAGGTGTAMLLVLRQLITIAAAWVLVGASTMVFIVTFFTLRHQLVPDHLLGRVVIITRVIAYAPIPVAPVIGGAVLSATGTFTPVIAVAAAAQICTAAVALFTPLRTTPGPAT